MEAPRTFDADGWLRIGFCGHQPGIGETLHLDRQPVSLRGRAAAAGAAGVRRVLVRAAAAVDVGEGVVGAGVSHRSRAGDLVTRHTGHEKHERHERDVKTMLKAAATVAASSLIVIAGVLGYVVATGLSARPAPGAIETRVARAVRRWAVPRELRAASVAVAVHG